MYQDLNGRIVCFDHLGAYAQAAFSRHPRSRRQETPLTVWERLTDKDVQEIEQSLCEMLGFDKYDVMCEDCSHDALVGKQRASKEH